MTRELAIKLLYSAFEQAKIKGVLIHADMAEARDMAIAALREPALDSNGLMPCGCGGKAKLVVQIESNYSVRCEKCGFRSGVLVGWEPAKTDTIKAWNRAMGVHETAGLESTKTNG